MGKIKYFLFTVLPILAIAAVVGYPMWRTYTNQKTCDNVLNEDPKEAIRACTELIEGAEEGQGPALNNRGLAWQKAGLYEEAISDFSHAIKEMEHPDIYRNRADTYNMMGNYKKALRDYDEGLELDPHNGALLNNTAWFLATCPKKKYRDGKRAVKLADRALLVKSTPKRLDTLAAAYAEVGDFKRAVEFQKELASSDIDGAAERLALYESQKPYRAPKP